MALTKPIVPSSPFSYDATTDRIFTFIVIGGDVVEKNQISIENNLTGAEVFTKTTTSRLYQSIVPSSTLTNGNTYRYRFRTYDINNNASDWSDYSLFYTVSSAVLNINITQNQIINASNYLVQATYSQAQNNRLITYMYTLYDSNDNIISSTGNIRDGLLRWNISGLLDNVTYKINLSVQDEKGLVTTTSKITFSINYQNPAFFAVLQLENVKNQGKIKATSNIINVGGSLIIGSGDVTYEQINGQDDIVVTTNGQKIEYSDGINIDGDFTLYLDTKFLVNGQEFLYVYGQDDTELLKKRIVMKYENGRIHVYNINGQVVYYIYSEPISFDDVNIKRIWLQQNNQLLDIKVP